VTNKLNELMYALLPETAFLAFSIRLIAFGASVGDSVALLVIASLIAYKRYMARAKMNELELIHSEIKALQEQLNTRIEEFQSDVQHVKDSLNGLKVDKAFSQQPKRPSTAVTPNEQEKKPRLFF
jgi:esterase/lipase